MKGITAQTLLSGTLKKFRDRVFMKIEGSEMTYGELDQRSNVLANAMANLGYGKGDKVIMILPNSMEIAILCLGLIKAGVTMTSLNIWLSEREISYILKDSGVRAVFVDPAFYDLVQKARGELPHIEHVIALGGDCPEGFISYRQFLSGADATDLPLRAAPEDEFLISYTGGTTGTPKGVIQTQSSVYFNLLSHCLELNTSHDEKLLLMTPLSHAAGLLMLLGMIKGATMVVEKKFDPFRALDLIESEKITTVFAVPTMIYVFLDILKQKKSDMSSIRQITYGAAPISEKRLAEALEVFGPVFNQAYGLTECPSMITVFPVADHLKALRDPSLLQSCGRPALMCQLRILNESGNDVPAGKVGEITVWAPYLMKGYLNKPDETAHAFTEEGWLRTSDMGRMDDNGYIYIVDRKKDMIISGGMNVYSIEVEEVIQRHAKVRQVSVIGIPDEHWGEAVTAIIVPAGECSEEGILDFCKDKMAKYMEPKKVIFRENLPLTAVLKVDKVALRAGFWSDKGRSVN
jgi:fatty-acyl-CoA synthase/long-chain acyl-CoA synthetase